MAHLNYIRLGRRWRRMRGFRLNTHRCSVHRLRVRLMSILHLLAGCLKPLKRGFRSCNNSNSSCERSMSRRGLVFEDQQQQQRSSFAGNNCKQRHCSRSNSFYAEAIADCLEFIKRSSVSVDNNPSAVVVSSHDQF
ncbi:uncharacterized protein LOC120267946 [Dioscorea cayenensis subsp. rotundata]|uniref:Uncharacterized protein LOC120267946 n=1 Tax=Dioscorea cayennensis subsp. rotundata TaxID=55577 RepID=A0AB40BWS6_DIOCR|nr:uncharacterized protein LOC120267946 [Dioscorea cayenensis subsp. rotundata]